MSNEIRCYHHGILSGYCSWGDDKAISHGSIFQNGQTAGNCVRRHATQGVGESTLFATPITAFFASRECPGTAIGAAMDWGMQHAKTRQPLIGGFHSALEQSVLKLLLQARSPVVAVLARPVAGAKLNTAWKTTIAEGRMAVVTAASAAERLTEEQARQRDDVVARLAASIVIAYASAGGRLARQSETWVSQGLAAPYRLVQ